MNRKILKITILTTAIFNVSFASFQDYNCNIFVKQVQSTSSNSDCFDINRGCGFQQALNIAMSNGQDDVICVKAGTYTINDRLRFYGISGENNSITIVGETDSSGESLVELDGSNSSQILNINLCLWNGSSCSFDAPDKKVRIENFILKNGYSNRYGGGLGVYTNSSLIEIKNIRFENNRAGYHGGGFILWSVSGDIKVENISAKQNQAPYYGGGGILWSKKGNITVYNSSFQKNNAQIGGGLLIFSREGSISLDNDVFSENISTGRSGGLDAYSQKKVVSLKNSQFYKNTSERSAGGALLWSREGSVLAENNSFKENHSGNVAGGLFVRTDTGDIYLNANLFYKNSSKSSGGGLYVYSLSSEDVFLGNNVFSEDSAQQYDGGNSFVYSLGKVSIINNTFNGGSSPNSSGRLLLWIPRDNAQAYIYNNIFWQGNSPQNVDVGIAKSYNTKVEFFNNITSCPIPYGTGICVALSNTHNYQYGNNISQDPLFKNPPVDLHISAGSPAIDRGNISAPMIPDKDKDGNPRIVGDSVDIGAYEYQETGGSEGEIPVHRGRIFVFPERYSFGFVHLGNSKTVDILVKNIGQGNLSIENIYFTTGNDFSLISNECSSYPYLSPDQSCHLTVMFSPTSVGFKKNKIEIKTDDEEHPLKLVKIKGIGISDYIPDIEVSKIVINFGKISVGSTENKNVTVSNIGNATLSIYRVLLKGKDKQDFSLNENCSGRTLEPGESCNISVSFYPSSQGEKKAKIKIFSNDPDEFKIKIKLRGKGI